MTINNALQSNDQANSLEFNENNMFRILLVEDEPANAAILASYLEMAGYQVEEASDGVQALSLLEKKPGAFHLVVTDKRMPNMNGLELAARLKADRRFSNIPVILQTGDTAHDEFIKGIKAGVYYYLSKPYEESTLLTIVRAAIVERERNDVFERRISSQQNALVTLMKGDFSFQTPEEAQNLAFLLGGIFPRPELAVSGLYELMLNAIEHGNLEIGYAEKGNLLTKGIWDQEIRRRLLLSENRIKRVALYFENFKNRLEVVVADDGKGFDWRPYLEIEPSRATHSNGRGIAKANLLSFDEIVYQDNGNIVKAISYKRVP